MNYLVTGGAGYIGSHTVVELINSGHKPTIVDNFNNSEKYILDRLEQITNQKIVCYEQDFQNTEELRKILVNENIDGVIHFAAYKQVAESVDNPFKYYENNVIGFIKLLELLEEVGIESFIFSSSCTVYGEPEKVPVTEDAEVKPAVSPYGATKQMDEIILNDATNASKKLKSISLRYFNPIGAHHSALIGELPKGVPANLVPLICQVAAGVREELQVYGNDYPTPDGTCIRDYINVCDLVKAHVRAIGYLQNKDAKFYDVFNIGIGAGNTVLEIINTFERVNGVKINYKITDRRQGDVTATFASVQKANQYLNWEPTHTLDQSLKSAWEWQKTLL